MSIENPLWGALRIHGELLKLGFEVAQSSVAKYMVKRGGPPSQGWHLFCGTTRRTLLRWICSLFRPYGFDLLYALVIIRLQRRDPVWINVTTHPTAEWIARPNNGGVPLEWLFFALHCLLTEPCLGADGCP